MPLTHSRTFRVRYYECDPYGFVRPAHLLRYMQEAAFDATAAAGYDIARYEAMGRLWLIRETELEVLQPLTYGDVVEVRTWVADFRRVRSRRAYEFRLCGADTAVVRAVTDWVFLDRAALRPVTIPQELKVAFFPEGVPASAPPRRRFVQPPLPPDGGFRRRRRVVWSDLDQAGHVNNAVYADYVEDCGTEMVAARGWPAARLLAEGAALSSVRHRLEYRLPALPGDELEIVTWFSEISEDRLIRQAQVMRRSDGALLVRAQSVQLWVEQATGRSRPMPARFLSDLSP